jgi:regulator of replication initiation timing
MMTKIKKLETDLGDCKQSLSREMLAARHLSIENEQMRRTIVQIEVRVFVFSVRKATNETLINSNRQIQEKLEKIKRDFLFYKQFYVENKDQLLVE